MKLQTLLIICCSIFLKMLLTGSVDAQNITNTLGTSGVFSIKDNTRTYLSLNQVNGTISLVSPLAGNQRSSIFKGNDRFLHTYNGTGTNGQNTFLGINAGNFTLGGTIFQGSYNTGVGYYSLASLTTGSDNSAFGNSALLLNTTGTQNSAFGVSALYNNLTGSANCAFGNNSLTSNTTGNYNSSFGYQSLYSNTTGYYNSAFGYGPLSSNSTGYNNSAFGCFSLFNNTTGFNNSSFGYQSLYNNSTGNNNIAIGTGSLFANSTGSHNLALGLNTLSNNSYGYSNTSIGNYSLDSNTTGALNTAVGYESLVSNKTGSFNTATGYYSLGYCTTGSTNTCFGYNAGINITTGSSNIALGSNSYVPNGTASNQIRLGNTLITYAGIQVAWTVTSDRKWKENILPSRLGLGFISRLNPVSYNRKNDESGKTEYGLIAQEVEDALEKEGAENTGMLTVTDDGSYELRYNDLLAPMIKAIQELKAENEELKKRIKKLELKGDMNTLTVNKK
jgi:hypothetical protein